MILVMEGKGRGAGLKLSSEPPFWFSFWFCILARSFAGLAFDCFGVSSVSSN